MPLESAVTRNLTPRAVPAVLPVVEYEPPPITVAAAVFAGGRPRPHRRPHLHVAAPAPERAAAPAAAAFADAALRRVLEVIDRRRPMAQLRPLLADELLDAVIGLARASHTAAAVLRRVRLRVVDRDGEAAEVFAAYSRGERMRAIAARVELVTVRNVRRWRIVALQIG
jgi:hypothetical protein